MYIYVRMHVCMHGWMRVYVYVYVSSRREPWNDGVRSLGGEGGRQQPRNYCLFLPRATVMICSSGTGRGPQGNGF